MQSHVREGYNVQICLAAFLEFDLRRVIVIFLIFLELSCSSIPFFLLFNSSSIPRVFMLKSGYITVPCLH